MPKKCPKLKVHRESDVSFSKDLNLDSLLAEVRKRSYIDFRYIDDKTCKRSGS